MTLLETFLSLPRPSREGTYCLESGAGRGFRVARGFSDHPALLISFGRSDGGSTPRRLAHLVYSTPAPVTVVSSAGAHDTAQLAIFECLTTDRFLTSFFFRAAESVLLGEACLANEVTFEAALDAIVTLFRSLSRPGNRTIQGLWAELAFILWSANPAAAVASWHSSPRALHDFSSGVDRLEIKSNAGGLREHAFRLEQLCAVPGGRILVASILLAESEGGMALVDLIERLSSALSGNAEIVRRLEAIVADSVGQQWREATELRFDSQVARDSLRLFSAEVIPCVPKSLPDEVKCVRFVVDLSTTEATNLVQARRLGSFFSSVLPGGGDG